MKMRRNPVRRFLTKVVQEALRRHQSETRLLAAQGAMLARRGQPRHYANLHDAELHVFSQWGEDGILDFLCDSLNIAKPRILEFGAGDFRECNSRYLAESRSASVVAVDARQDLFRAFEQSSLMWRTTVHPLIRFLTPTNAAEVFAEAKHLFGGRPPDIFSLDLDGVDYWIMESLDLSGVQIILVEYNPLFGAEFAVSVPKSETFDRRKEHSSWLYFGASLRAWIHLLGSRGYEFVGTNRQGNNAFFIQSSSTALVPVDRVDLAELDAFVQWNVRESRDDEGRLSYLSGSARGDAIRDMPLVDVLTGGVTTVSATS